MKCEIERKMRLVIYADILFLVNFVMDGLALYVCKKVLSFDVKLWRIILSSAVGGVYGVASELVTLPEPFSMFAVACGMVAVAFGIRSISAFFKALLLFYTASMLFGGIMTFLQNAFYSYRNAELFANGIDLKLFLIISVICVVFTVTAGRIFRAYAVRKSVKAELSLPNGRKITVTLLCDSGNTLRDPYSDKPVLVVKADVIRRLLGDDATTLLDDCDERSALLATKYKLRYISAKTVVGGAVLPVFGVISVALFSKKGKANAVSAVVATDVFSSSDYAGFDGILPYSLIWSG